MFKKETYYSLNKEKFKKYYNDNRIDKIEYQKEYNKKKYYDEMKNKLINYEIIINNKITKKRSKVDYTLKISHGIFEVNFD